MHPSPPFYLAKSEAPLHGYRGAPPTINLLQPTPRWTTMARTPRFNSSAPMAIPHPAGLPVGMPFLDFNRPPPIHPFNMPGGSDALAGRTLTSRCDQKVKRERLKDMVRSRECLINQVGDSIIATN